MILKTNRIVERVPTSAKAGIKERVTVCGSRKVSCDNHMCHRHHKSGSCRQTLNENPNFNLEGLEDHYSVPGLLYTHYPKLQQS
jgi:hypothetical protein